VSTYSKDDYIVHYGVSEPLPLSDFPEGRVRICMRNDGFTKVYIRPPIGGIREFRVHEVDGKWLPCYEQGRNIVMNG